MEESYKKVKKGGNSPEWHHQVSQSYQWGVDVSKKTNLYCNDNLSLIRQIIRQTYVEIISIK